MASMAELLSASRQAPTTPFSSDPSEGGDGSVFSMLKGIGGAGLGAVASVGNFLDLPGSSVRDLLAGENPFDQWMSPLSDENRTTGRQLLEGFGMRKNKETGLSGWLSDPGEGLRDLAGFAAEVVLDPFGPVTAGLMTGTKAGARLAGAASKAHPLVRGIGHGAKTVFDTLPAKFTGSVLKRAKGAARAGRSLFSPPHGGITDAWVQPAAAAARKKIWGLNEEAVRTASEAGFAAERAGFFLKADDTLDMKNPQNWNNPKAPIMVRAREEAMRRHLEGVDGGDVESFVGRDLVTVGSSPELKEVEWTNRTEEGISVKLIGDDILYSDKHLTPAFMQNKVQLPDEVKAPLDVLKGKINEIQGRANAIGYKGLGQDQDAYGLYFPRNESDALRQGKFLADMEAKSWRSGSQSLVATLRSPGGRDMMYKGFRDKTMGVQRLFRDEFHQSEVERLAADTSELGHLGPDGKPTKVFDGRVGPRHLQGFADAMGREVDDVWDELTEGKPTAMLPVSEVESSLARMRRASAREVAEDPSKGFQPGVGWWKSYTNALDPTGNAIHNLNLNDASRNNFQAFTNASDLAAAHASGMLKGDDALHNLALAHIHNGSPVYIGSRIAKKGEPAQFMMVTPTKKAKLDSIFVKTLNNFREDVSAFPLREKEGITDTLRLAVERNYGHEIDKWMPEMNADGKIVAHSADPSSTSSEAIHADGLSGWQRSYPYLKDSMKKFEETGFLPKPARALLRLTDESLTGLQLSKEVIDDIHAIRDNVNRRVEDAADAAPDEMARQAILAHDVIKQDAQIGLVNRHQALAEELTDHVMKRALPIYNSSAPIAGHDYVKKNGTGLTLVESTQDVITELRVSGNKLQNSSVGTGAQSGNVDVNYDPSKSIGMSLGDVLEDGPNNLFGGSVEPATFLENTRQKWIQRGLLKNTDDPDLIAKQLMEIKAVRAPAGTWNELRTYNEISGAANLPELEGAMRIAASINAYWKSGVLSTAPATAVRDGSSSFFNAILMGDMNPVTALYNRGKDAASFARGGHADPGEGVKEIMEFLAQQGMKNTPENRSAAFLNWWNAHHSGGSVHPNVIHADEARMGSGDSTMQLLSSVPNPSGKSMVSNVSDMLKEKGAFNPMKVAGTYTKDKLGHHVQRSTSNAPISIMNAFRTNIDTTNRALFVLDRIDKTKSLKEAFAASDRVLLNAHPKNFTRFEHQYLKSIIPFYSFMRQSIPMFLQELVVNPGGRLGQTIRATRQGQGSESGYVPYDLQDTTAIGLEERDDGTIKYLTSLGLMHEDAVKYAGNILQGDLRGLMQKMLSSGNPALKWAVEHSTNTSLFSQGPMGGRRLDEMDPTLGRIATNLGLQELAPSGRAKPVVSQTFESLLSSSPLSRVASSVKIGTTPVSRSSALEKVARLLTGLRVETITPEKITLDIRDRANALQVKMGARPLMLVSGVKNLKDKMASQGDKDSVLLLEKLESILAASKKRSGSVER